MNAKSRRDANPSDRPATQIPSCALSEHDLGRQLEGWRGLASSVTRMRRLQQRLSIELAPDFDRLVLEELIAVERECCPFFTLSLDERSRRLEVGVDDAQAAAALDAIEHSISRTAINR
jgi:hypothetical protein